MAVDTRQPVAPAARHAARGRGARFPGWGLVALTVVGLGLTAFMVSAYLPPDITTSRVPMHGDQLHFWLLVAHIGTAAVATVTGFGQFWPWLRRRYPMVHRWTGRVYFFGGVFPSVVLAVPVALLSQFGASYMLALLAVDAVWLGTAVAGYRTIRQRRYAEHRRWMIRNFATLLSSLASRLWQVALMLMVVPQLHWSAYGGDSRALTHDIASASIWVSLGVNLLIAELYIQRRLTRRRVPTRVPPQPTAADRAPVPSSR
ncbi:MAG: DUF2306 domain-containing protein [Actinocatenispora sp.]